MSVNTSYINVRDYVILIPLGSALIKWYVKTKLGNI